MAMATIELLGSNHRSFTGICPERGGRVILEAVSRPLLSLFHGVVAWLAQRLQVLRIEEQIAVTLVRCDVVADQLRGIALDPSTSGHLASEVISGECLDAQSLPLRKLIPLAPRLCRLPVAVPLLLITWHWPETRRQLADPCIESGKSAHTHNAKRRPSGRPVIHRRIAVALALNRCLTWETVRAGCGRET